jgi:hypothetical protein
MAESTSTRGKPPGPQRAASSREAQRGYGRAPALSVRFWKKMRIQKVYPVDVTWVGAGRDGGEPITLRLVMAGAQVVPSELTLDPNEPRAKATFYVTPLAQGGLRGEKLEVLQQGKKIQEIRTPCTVTSQRGTLFWLFLAFFLPWLMMHYFMYSPVGYKPPLKHDGTEKIVSKPWLEKVRVLDAKKNEVDVEVDIAGAKLITERIKQNTPSELEEPLGETYEDIRSFPGDAYANAFQQYHELKQPIAFYIFLGLLVVTFLSFVFRLESRKRVTGRPLPLGEASED